MRKFRQAPTINAGSMADIAFLLLIFFLVSTQILNEKGIKIILPDYLENAVQQPNKSDILAIFINKNNDLLVDNNERSISILKSSVKEFISNKNNIPSFASSPQKAVITLNCDDKTNYQTYLKVYAEIKQAYIEMWSEKSMELFNKSVHLISAEQLKTIKQSIPLRISEVEKFVNI